MRGERRIVIRQQLPKQQQRFLQVHRFGQRARAMRSDVRTFECFASRCDFQVQT